MKRATIFDMDGVIADSQRIHSMLEEQLLAEYGIHMSAAEITRRFSGVSAHDMFTKIFAEARKECPNITILSDEKARRFLQCRDQIVPVPGTIEVLRELKGRGHKVAIASASRRESIDMVLDVLGLNEMFDAIASSKEVSRGKPAPDVFLLAAHRVDIAPKYCTVIEDGVSGMLGARAAQMRCVALVPNPAAQTYPAHLIVTDLRQVPIEWFDQ